MSESSQLKTVRSLQDRFLELFRKTGAEESALLRKVGVCLTLAVLVSVLLASSIHFALHHSSPHDDHCLFCKHLMDSQVDQPLLEIPSVHLSVAGMCVTFPPRLESLFFTSLKCPRAPPPSCLTSDFESSDNYVP